MDLVVSPLELKLKLELELGLLNELAIALLPARCPASGPNGNQGQARVQRKVARNV